MGFHQPPLPFYLITPIPKRHPQISPHIHQKICKGCRNNHIITFCTNYAQYPAMGPLHATYFGCVIAVYWKNKTPKYRWFARCEILSNTAVMENFAIEHKMWDFFFFFFFFFSEKSWQQTHLIWLKILQNT